MFYIIFQDKHPSQKKKVSLWTFLLDWATTSLLKPDCIEPRGAKSAGQELLPCRADLQTVHQTFLPLPLCRDYTANSLSSRFNLQHFIFQVWHFREIRLTNWAILKELIIEWENWSCALTFPDLAFFCQSVNKYLNAFYISGIGLNVYRVFSGKFTPEGLKIWSLRSINITWLLVSNVHSWAPPQNYWIRNSGVGTQPSAFKDALQGILLGSLRLRTTELDG